MQLGSLILTVLDPFKIIRKYLLKPLAVTGIAYAEEYKRRTNAGVQSTKSILLKLIAAVLVGFSIVWASIFMYAYFYYTYMPTVSHVKDVYLNYSQRTAAADSSQGRATGAIRKQGGKAGKPRAEARAVGRSRSQNGATGGQSAADSSRERATGEGRREGGQSAADRSRERVTGESRRGGEQSDADRSRERATGVGRRDVWQSVADRSQERERDCLSEQKCLGYPSDTVVLTKKQQFLMVGQAYKVTLYLEMPESIQNDNTGMFTVCATMQSRSSAEFSVKSCRLSMVHFKSGLLKMMTTVMLAPFYILGYREEKQTVAIDLFTHFEDSQAHPVTSVDVAILSRDIQFYSAQLHITANFSGLRYVMFNWPIVSAAIGILTNLFFIVIICVLSWYHWDDTEWLVEIKDRYHQMLKSTPIRAVGLHGSTEPVLALPKEELQEKPEEIEEVSSFKDDLGLAT
ncbi:hypothetical protein RP20_CCG018302 [Aedes albopictus]|nr:hypothetical protein RP20_CCG018302 [Aedes albopictus]